MNHRQILVMRKYPAPLGGVHVWIQDDQGSECVFHYDCVYPGIFSVLVNSEISEAVMNPDEQTITFAVPPPPGANIVLMWNEKQIS